MTNKSKEIKASIIIYNCFLKKGEHHLNPIELYFYGLLAARQSHFIKCTETTLNILADIQQYYDDKNNNRKASKVRDVLMSLRNKGAINIEPSEKLSPNTLFRVTFPFFDGGYEHMYPELYNEATEPDYLYVFAIINQIKGYEKAKDKWGNVLGYSETKGETIINKMISDGKIHFVEGNKYTDDQGRTKQRATKWYLGNKPEHKQKELEIESEAELVRFETVVKDEEELSESYMTIFGEWTLTDIEKKIKHSNWGKSGKLILEDDIYLLMTLQDLGIKKPITSKWNNTLNKWRKDGNNMSSIDEHIKSYRKKKLDKQKELEQNKNNEEVAKNSDGKLLLKDKDENLVALDVKEVKQLTIEYLYENFISVECNNVSYKLWGGENSIFGRCYRETKDKVFMRMIEMFTQAGKVDCEALKEYKNSIIKENNKNRPYNVEHEGDVFIGYGVNDEENVSLKNRIMKHTTKKKFQHDNKNDEEKIDLTTLLD